LPFPPLSSGSRNQRYQIEAMTTINTSPRDIIVSSFVTL
jgi:hypothetical protein